MVGSWLEMSDLFSKYKTFYVERCSLRCCDKHAQMTPNTMQHTQAVQKDELLDAIERLKKLDSKNIKTIERSVGIFPMQYPNFLTEIRYDEILCVKKRERVRNRSGHR
jgi:hypothetical protein